MKRTAKLYVFAPEIRNRRLYERHETECETNGHTAFSYPNKDLDLMGRRTQFRASIARTGVLVDLDPQNCPRSKSASEYGPPWVHFR